jgi:16S rRNA U1498 N3-methylase RsmE
MNNIDNIEIRSDIAIPQLSTHYLYPFERMKVGDFFCVPLDKANRVRSVTSDYNKKHESQHFITRTRKEDGVQVVRVWRAK